MLNKSHCLCVLQMQFMNSSPSMTMVLQPDLCPPPRRAQGWQPFYAAQPTPPFGLSRHGEGNYNNPGNNETNFQLYFCKKVCKTSHFCEKIFRFFRSSTFFGTSIKDKQLFVCRASSKTWRSCSCNSTTSPCSVRVAWRTIVRHQARSFWCRVYASSPPRKEGSFWTDSSAKAYVLLVVLKSTMRSSLWILFVCMLALCVPLFRLWITFDLSPFSNMATLSHTHRSLRLNKSDELFFCCAEITQNLLWLSNGTMC